VSDHDLILAEREETRAERDADAREHHQRLMALHYRYRLSHPVWRAAERVRSGSWCPAGTAREVPMPVDFGHWAVERHPDASTLFAALFADRADEVMLAYAEDRARADADALEVES